MPDDSPTDVAAGLLRSALERRLFPGAVAEVGSSQGIIWTHSCGALSFDADARAVGPDTVFDLASLTKPLAATAVALHLAAKGVLPLDRRVTELCPEWQGEPRFAVTIQDLLEHAGGLSARLLDTPPDDARVFEHEICLMPLEYQPRTRSIYTDLGFILLGIACARAAEVPFRQLVDDLLVRLAEAPRSSPDAGELFTTVPADVLRRTAPTTPMAEDRRRGRRLMGEVHDNYAAALGGLAGHAGLFGTAPGVGHYARSVLRAARGDNALPPPFTPEWVLRARTRSRVPGSSRALGWDTMKPSSSCGTRLSPEAFGHVGFTGTSLWIDPVSDRYFVLLSNRVCEGGTSEEMQALRRAFHDSLAEL